MRLRRLLPEAIPGPAAYFYAYGPGRVFRPVQERLAKEIDALLSSEARLFLDIGCGPAFLSHQVARRRPQMKVVAVDLSETMVSIARRNTAEMSNIEVRRENAAELSQGDGSVDMIVSVGSMHHWREPVRILDELYRVLRPGGRAWIIDGRDDFTRKEQEDWLRVPSWSRLSPLLAVQRRILRVHGYTQREWSETIPERARRSRFGGGVVSHAGVFGRLELEKRQKVS